MRKTTLTLAGLAALRLTRFVTSDTLGDWLLVHPAKRWATKHEGGDLVNPDGELVEFKPHEISYVFSRFNGPYEVKTENGWRSKLVSGLDCPFCVGFWIGSGVLAVSALAERSEGSRKLFHGVAGSLGLNYVTGHISSRLD